jgi:hypothetical protein
MIGYPKEFVNRLHDMTFGSFKNIFSRPFATLTQAAKTQRKIFGNVVDVFMR